MRILIDTNRYTDLAAGEVGALDVLRRSERVFVPFVVLGELRAGFARGSKSAQNEKLLHRFLAKPSVRCLFADDQTCHHYARIYAQFRQAGSPIPTNDLWIAALALQHGLTLFSRDAHFGRIPQLLTVL